MTELSLQYAGCGPLVEAQQYVLYLVADFRKSHRLQGLLNRGPVGRAIAVASVENWRVELGGL